ncbi:MAG: fructose PTS transporter subunit IIB [Chloroflexi bacterium]|nr:fructose PTS transporter subunit IIB [Chloroflexota bacterium]
MRIVAVTSCATGIAHSYMAAEALKRAAKASGDQIKVEVQGAMGIEGELSKDDIAAADFVIWAIDVGVRRPERFPKAKVAEFNPHEAIRDPGGVIQKAKQKIRLAPTS